MIPKTILTYIEQDDEYMYFEVHTLSSDPYNPEYDFQGTIYIGKVKGIER